MKKKSEEKLILAIETSDSNTSVALLKNHSLLSKSSILEKGKQAELLVDEIEKILHQNFIWYQDLNLLAVNHGPGSFTGVRIGLAVAKTIRFSTNLPLITVNSCEAIAYKYQNFQEEIIVVLNAGFEQFFCANFLWKNKRLLEIRSPFLANIEMIDEFLPKNNFLICGNAKNNFVQIIAKNYSNFQIGQDLDFIEADLIGKIAYQKFLDHEIKDEINPLYLKIPSINQRKK